jgi:hypothetical protein
MVFTASAANILLVFFLVLLVKWSWVKRPSFFLIGACAVAADLLLGGIFGSFQASWAAIVGGILNSIFAVVGFGAGIVACYAGTMPVSLPGEKPQ